MARRPLSSWAALGAHLDGGDAAAMGPSALEPFLAHVQADPVLRRQVSCSDLLRFSGRSV